MSALLDELLDGYVTPVRVAFAVPTPAKAAKAANREHPCGLPADSGPCESLRISANPEPVADLPAPDSQAFADIRRPQNGPQGEQRRGFSQDSQDSQGVAGSKHSRRGVVACTDCLHLLARGSCGEPVAAGLRTAADGYGIVWPPAGHGAGCAGYTGKTPSKAPERPYRLTKDGADAAHAEPWDEAAIARFQSRVQRIARLGIATDDADDLAERLHLRDLDDDDRHLCPECAHYRPGRCGNHRAAGLCVPELARDLTTQLQRCPGIAP